MSRSEPKAVDVPGRDGPPPPEDVRRTRRAALASGGRPPFGAPPVLLLVAALTVPTSCGPGGRDDLGGHVGASSEALSARIDSIGRALGATVGVAAVHLGTGERFHHRADDPYPMASVYKLPIALAVLHEVETGGLRLDSAISFGEGDFAPHHSPLADEGAPGGPLSVDTLLALMLGGSDNTATDLLLRAVGGPPAVTRYLRGLGIAGIRVDRSERELGLDQRGVGAWPPGLTWSRSRFDSLASAVPPPERRAAEERFLEDPRDTATPAAMVELLGSLHRGEALSPASLERVRAILRGSTLGARRIPRILPPGTEVLHKTGTAGSITNDAGLVVDPATGEASALAIFVKGADRSLAEREDAIAEIARLVYGRLHAHADSCVAPDASVALDHVVAAVDDLDRARARWAGEGFTIKPGRPHANGLLNAHVKFRDSTQLELMAVPGPPTDEIARGYRDFLRSGEGGAFVAFRSLHDDVVERAGATDVRAQLLGDRYVVFPDLPTVFALRPGGPRVTDPDSLLTHANGASGVEEAWLEAGDGLVRLLIALGARDCGPVEPPAGAGVEAMGRSLAIANGRVVVLPVSDLRRPVVRGVVLSVDGPSESDAPSGFQGHGIWIRFADDLRGPGSGREGDEGRGRP